MPHLRFSRDRDGYEHTYIFHAQRREGPQRRRLLYWFRSPPGIRVGRAPLDEDAVRALEANNPDLEFDWPKILAQRPSPTGADRRPEGRRPRSRVAAASPSTRGRRSPRKKPVPTAAPTEEAAPPEARGGPEAAALVPVTVYHGGADVMVTTPTAGARSSPAEERLGSETVARLRARHAELLARIRERADLDPTLLAEARRNAEALDPSTWVTEGEIAEGVRRFDRRLGAIRQALGFKPRRGRGRGHRRRPGEHAPPAPDSMTSSDPSDA